MKPILVAENVNAGYGDVIIVHDVSVEVSAGEIAAIVGPNGSGKSTLIKSILGFAKLFQGSILYHDKDITGLPSHRAVNLGIGYVPQTDNVFPNLTIAENLDMGAYNKRGKDTIKTAKGDIFHMFPELAAREKALAENLSGGERQMLAIARAMMAEPKVLLLDEPLASLSPKPSAVIESKLEQIRETGIAILIVEQNVKKALELSKRGYVLVNGALAMRGESASLLADDSFKERFLGLEQEH